MQDVIYLFKDRLSCCDIFQFLFNEMIKRNFNCIKIVDEKNQNTKQIIDSLVGKKIILITADHLNNKIENSYSIMETISLLKPIKTYWSIHDLGCNAIKDPISNFNVLLPGSEWIPLTMAHENVKNEIVGYPKFYNINFEKKYDSIFFPSLIYIYNNKPVYEWINNFKFIIDNNYPIKFPNYKGSIELIEKIEKEKIHLNLVDLNLDSFDLMSKSNIVITNSNSSVAIEAAILGCNSINIGKPYTPKNVYSKFKVNIISKAENILQCTYNMPNAPMLQYMFNIDKAIDIITK